MKIKRNDTYEDIMNLPHHVSTRRPQMSIHDRAAQFAPFAALTGHDAAIKETARLTESKIELDENEIQLIDQKLQYIMQHLEQRPAIAITYFLPDGRKSGGKYVEIEGVVKKIDELEHNLVMCDGLIVPIKDILRINLEITP